MNFHFARGPPQKKKNKIIKKKILIIKIKIKKKIKESLTWPGPVIYIHWIANNNYSVYCNKPRY